MICSFLYRDYEVAWDGVCVSNATIWRVGGDSVIDGMQFTIVT